ncbi:MAG: hypothetical protein ACRCZF_20715, partial [Gemmataceae bacterium]
MKNRRFLFVKDGMAWPRSSGHDVHTFHMMQALVKQGHAVALATRKPAPDEAVAHGGFSELYTLDDAATTA